MKFAVSAFFSLAFVVASSAQSAQPVPIEAGVPQLFVDDFLIDTQQDLRRTLHQPKKDLNGDQPIIALDEELAGSSGTLEANGTILFDPKLKKHVMFALGFFATNPGPDRVRLYRFTSDDAMTWIKGDDGKPQHIRIDLSDAAGGAGATNIDLFSCCHDARDATFPYQGWVWLANFAEREGIYFVQSRDGKAWERGPLIARHGTRKIEQDGRTLVGPSDVSIFYHDAAAKRFLAALKFNLAAPVGNNYLRSRGYLFVDRLDQPLDLSRVARVALVPAGALASGDQPEDEYYGSTAWRYGSHWLGGLKVWHRGGDYPYSAAGCAFLKLAASRDGLEWKKVRFDNDAGVPEVFIANGAEGGNDDRKDGRNDGGYLTEFSQGPLRIGDELIFYYGSSSWGKNHPPGKRVTGGGIFRARLRPDGFVSVDGGTLTTKPLALKGSELLINAVGPVTVELLDANEPPIDIAGDSISHKVRLKQPINDRPVRLRFHVKPGGRLYSFTVR